MAGSPLVWWRVMTRPKPGAQACSPPRARAAPPHHRLVPPRARRVPGGRPCALPPASAGRLPDPGPAGSARTGSGGSRNPSPAPCQALRSSRLGLPSSAHHVPGARGRWLSSSTLDASRVPTVCLSHPCSSGPVCVKYVNKLKHLLWAASFMDGLI